MNKVFKTMWNAAKGMFVVVNEKSGCGQSCGSSQKLKGGGRVNPCKSDSATEQGLFTSLVVKKLLATFVVSLGLLSGVSYAGGSDPDKPMEPELGKKQNITICSPLTSYRKLNIGLSGSNGIDPLIDYNKHQALTIDHIKQLDKKHVDDDGFNLLENAVYNETLVVNKTKFLLGEGGDYNKKLGVYNIVSVDEIFINNGLELTLLGADIYGNDTTAQIIVEQGRLNIGVTPLKQDPTTSYASQSLWPSPYKGKFSTIKVSEQSIVNVSYGKYSVNEITGRGTVNVNNDASIHISKVDPETNITNKGTFIANAGAVIGDVSSSGVIKVESYKGDANSKFTSTGTLIADSFTTDGFTYFSKDSMLAIGDIDQQTTFFLENLDIAKKVVEAGGTVHQKVIDALKEQGMIPANFSLASAEDRLLEEGKPEANKDPVIAQSSARRVISTVSREGRLAASALTATVHNTARMESEVFAKTSGLWVDVGGAKDEFDAYKSDRYGLMLGYQASDESNGLTFGLVGRYADGKLKGADLAQDDWTSMGASVYAGWQNDKFFTLGSLGFDQHEAEGQNKINLDEFSGSANFGMKLPVGSMMLSPFVGVEAVHFAVDEADSTTTWRFPIGVRASGQYQTWGGWMMHPAMSIAFVPQSGDKTIVLDRGIESTFAGDYAVQTKVGFNAKKENIMLGLTYSGMTGQEGLRSHALQARASYLF